MAPGWDYAAAMLPRKLLLAEAAWLAGAAHCISHAACRACRPRGPNHCWWGNTPLPAGIGLASSGCTMLHFGAGCTCMSCAPHARLLALGKYDNTPSTITRKRRAHLC